MRIGLFTTDFPFKGPFYPEDQDLTRSLWGGVAEVAYDLSMHLNSKGHEVKVFTTSPIKEDIFQQFQSIEVFRYGWTIKVENTLLSPALLWKPLQHELDMVHSHLGTPPGAFAGHFYSMMKQRPLMLTIHAAYNPTLFSDGTIMKTWAFDIFDMLIYKAMLKRAAIVTAVSNSVLKESPSCAEFLEKTRVIPNGLNLHIGRRTPSKTDSKKELDLDTERRLILYVGNLSPIKNPDLLIRAFSRLDQHSNGVTLVLLGEGTLRESLNALIKEFHLEDLVKLPGFISGEEKYRYFQAADLFVLPSKSESFGLVALEAMSFGLPLIVSDLDIFKELFEENKNCLFFKSGDELDLSSKLMTLLSNEELRNAMVDNNRRMAERFDMTKVLEQYDKVYLELIQGTNIIKKKKGLEAP